MVQRALQRCNTMKKLNGYDLAMAAIIFNIYPVACWSAPLNLTGGFDATWLNVAASHLPLFVGVAICYFIAIIKER